MSIKTELDNAPKRIAQEYITPLNAFFLFPTTVSMVLDFLSPLGPLLIITAIVASCTLIWSLYKGRASTDPRTATKKNLLRMYALGACIVVSGSAIANFKHRNDGGAVANWVPKVKTWQDSYLVGIKKDTVDIKLTTSAIQKDTTHIDQEVSKTNAMLASLLGSMRPQLEKTLVDEVPGYTKLKKHQQDALVLFTSKVGTNGIKRYKKLIASVGDYAKNPTDVHERDVTSHLNYIVRVNGKTIEDTKTRELVVALFLNPALFDYLTGSGTAPDAPQFFAEFHIDPTKPGENQITDPLGDLIHQLESNGTPVNEAVVIPKSEAEPSHKNQTPRRLCNAQGICAHARFM